MGKEPFPCAFKPIEQTHLWFEPNHLLRIRAVHHAHGEAGRLGGIEECFKGCDLLQRFHHLADGDAVAATQVDWLAVRAAQACQDHAPRAICGVQKVTHRAAVVPDHHRLVAALDTGHQGWNHHAIGDVKTKGEVAEPAIELYDKDNNLSDFLASKFQGNRDYTSGLIGKLEALEKEGKIKTLKIKRLYFGSFFMEGYNLMAWKSL